MAQFETESGVPLCLVCSMAEDIVMRTDVDSEYQMIIDSMIHGGA